MTIKMNTCECIKSELDIFSQPAIQRMIQSGFWEEILPVGEGFSGNSPIEFYVTESGDQYFDPSSTYLYIQCKILDKEGKVFSPETMIAPVNNFLGSLWKEVSIELNNTKVSSSNISYPYRAYFETLLNYGEDAKKSVLQAQLIFKDDNDAMDSTTLKLENDKDKPNSGFLSRYEISKGSKPFEMMGKIHADILFQNRLILNNVSMRIKLTPNSSDFCLIGSGDNIDNAKIKILKASLFIRRVNINPEVIEGHIAAFRSGANAVYPIKRIETLYNLLNAGITSQSINLMQHGVLPRRIVFGFVENNVLSGNINKNPFHFKHHNLKELKLSINGVTAPYKELSFDFTNDEYLRGYHSLFTGIDKPVFSTGNNIDRKDWGKGYTIFAFDLTPDLSSSDYFNLTIKGKIRVDISFNIALTTPITLISYLEYEDKIEITEERKVLYEVS